MNDHRDSLTVITQWELCVKILVMVCNCWTYPSVWCDPSHFLTRQLQGPKRKEGLTIRELCLKVEVLSTGPSAILRTCRSCHLPSNSC